MIDQIYSMLIILCECLCAQIFIGTFTTKRSNTGKIVSFGLFILWWFGNYLCVLFLREYFGIKLMVILLCSSIYFTIIYKLRIWRAIVFYSMFIGLAGVLEYATIMIVSMLYPHLSLDNLDESWTGILLVLMGKLIIFYCIIMIRKLFEKKAFQLSMKEWIIFSFCPAFSIAALVGILSRWRLIEKKEQSQMLVGISLGLVTINFIFYYLLYSIVEREEQVSEARVLRERAKRELLLYQSMGETFQKQQKKAHEYSNQLQCIQELVHTKQYEELDKYMGSLKGEMEAYRHYINTNHPMANAVLNAAYRECRKEDITPIWKISDLSQLWLEDEDIVVILANLLNNAREACAREKSKTIKIKCVVEEERAIISVCNPISEIPVKVDGKYVTTKTDKVEHGIGIQNVIEAVKKYNGDYIISTENHEFHFIIIIPRRKPL